MKFDWDDEKAELNLKNHGVSFDEATEVFFDDWAIEEFDRKHSDFIEQRLTIIGLSKNRYCGLHTPFARMKIMLKSSE